MKTLSRSLFVSLLAALPVVAQDDPTYVNFIKQVQLTTPNNTEIYMSNIAPTGADPSPMPINPEGARFEIWTVRSSPNNSFLLQTVYAHGLKATVVIDTEDPWGKEPNTDTFTNVTYANPTFATAKKMPKNAPAVVRRTRADRPFKVYVEALGLKEATDATAAEAAKKVNFVRHLQSYGTNGTGNNIDRSQAILATPAQPQITQVGVQNPLVIPVSSIAGADRRKLRGEETFSVWTIDNEKLSSDYLQIWPMTDGVLSGVTMNQVVKFAMPTVTFQYTDTYPGSQTFAQIYKGEVRDNASGLIIPGSHKNNTSQIPENNLESTGSEFDRMFDSDGRWTIEILTVSPFDTIRLHYVTITIDRTIEVNGSFTTIE
ncbi:MAG: hypothetical protein EOP88_07625 [Verrucomicrobiaceae bacterium]|nr:MAG: hypothetical protein EOP88_07625 [Verrucomicrobiaceae bacterium]